MGIADNEDGAALMQEQAGLTRFVTCSSDRTVRFWHFADTQSMSAASKTRIQKGLYRNAYSKDMSRIIFVKNQDQATAQDFEVFKAKPLDRNQEGHKITQENDDGSLDQIEVRRAQNIEQAIRCLRVSPDGSMLACGDWYGNIRIHDLNSEKLDEIHCIEAHENEILSLDFALANESKASLVMAPEQPNHCAKCVLVSGSRDHLVQVYDSANNFDPV